VAARLSPGDWVALQCVYHRTPVINSYTGPGLDDIVPLATIEVDNLADACVMAASKKLFTALDAVMCWFTHTNQDEGQTEDDMPSNIFDAAIEALSAATSYQDAKDYQNRDKTLSATTTDTTKEDYV
jgi:hypothetical protein